jgi:probable HAF family extracellular repeat protein
MPPDPVAPYSINYASINNAGQIAGSTYDIGGFLWTSSTDIRQLLAPDGMHGASVYGVNDVGVTVGQAPLEGTHQYPACVWDAEGNGQYLDIFSGWHSEALDVNNAGQVVGWSENYSAETGNRAFLWDETNGMQNLGTLEGGGGSSARAINNLGQVVGDVGFPLNETRAFIWDAENGMRPLESPEGLLSEACDINDAGQIVGRAGRNGFAALWENGEILNIDVEVGHPAGWGGIRILAINNSGQMVGWGENPEDQYRALLLTPVPEPAAGAMLLAGALALAALGRLRARGPG